MKKKKKNERRQEMRAQKDERGGRRMDQKNKKEMDVILKKILKKKRKEEKRIAVHMRGEKSYTEEIKNRKRKKFVFSRNSRNALIFFGALIFLSVVIVFAYYKLYGFIVGLVFLIVMVFAYLIFRVRLKRYQNLKKMEDAFPDFISLMSSNLRAGMTIDRALLLSSRKEFEPLDKEILILGKDIVTGKEVSRAMFDMVDRIKSDEIKKTIQLIVSGIRSGGNLSVLLEQVSSSMKERMYIKKRAASNVLMYVILIFFATAVGAPFLFGLSSVLVEILSQLLLDVPKEQVSSINLPFVITQINVSVKFVLYFCLAFLFMTDIFASMVIGLVSKGKEREGFKFIVPLILVGFAIFFLSRFVILKYIGGAFR